MDVGAVAQATVAVASIFMRVVEVDASTGSPHERRRKIREENSRDLLPALMGIPGTRSAHGAARATSKPQEPVDAPSTEPKPKVKTPPNPAAAAPGTAPPRTGGARGHNLPWAPPVNNWQY